jgi:DNA-binding MarR family transcriptional regulator
VGLTPAQHQLLLAIKGTDGDRAPTIREIADSLRLQHHSVVELVDRAVAAGLLERRTDPGDARCQRLVATRRGEDKLAKLAGLHRDELRRFREEMLEHLAPLG